MHMHSPATRNARDGEVTVTGELTSWMGSWTKYGIGALGLCMLAGGCTRQSKPFALRQEALGGEAARFVVDRADDATDGACVRDGDSAGRCNLRAALAAAATAPSPVTIALAVDSTIDQGEIALNVPSGASLAIAGAAHRIDGNRGARLFTVAAGVTLALDDVVISNFAAYDGGAIVNHGSLALHGATLANNAASCSDVGAQTAYALCDGGAIENDGQLTIDGGTRFENNHVDAAAMTAAFTTSNGSGGAIASSGAIVIDGPVTFAGNGASATSVSGVHPIPVGGADASAAGGAIYNGGGSLTVTGAAIGHCTFDGNSAVANASASNSQQPSTRSAVGGAIYSQGQLVLPGGACVFANDAALTDPDVHDASALAGQLDEATQSIVFAPGVDAAWADLHLTINGTRPSNVRMRQDGSRFVAGPLALRAEDVLAYSFTYFAGQAGHDSGSFTQVVPLTFQPKALRPEVRRAGGDDAYLIRLVATAALDWADVHYSLNGGPQLNVRLGDVGGGLGLPLTLAPDDTLTYWMTYSANGATFDTAVYSFHPSAPTTATPWTDGFPVVNAGDTVPAGCAPANGWYTCDPYSLSEISTTGNYHVANDATVVPFQIVGTGPYGTSLIKTIQVAFQYAGAAPRVGTGIARLPTSAAHNGLPPLDAADRDRGKFVAPTWSLRVSYLLGGEGLAVALVDVNGLRSNALDVATYRSSYCRYGCALKVPVADLASGTDIDLSQIRYVELLTEDTATTDPSLVAGNILFDDFAFE
jgi:hypothetical protein